MAQSWIINGDCLTVLPRLPQARMVFLDPPDNLGIQYDGFRDRMAPGDYYKWLCHVVLVACMQAPIVWLSHYYRHTPELLAVLPIYAGGRDPRLFLWRYTFGQHQKRDCGNGYRPILRLAEPKTVWHTDAIRTPSARQRNGDRRADPRGRVPDDVWEFSRVCGTFRERRSWALNQHPEALLERIIKLSCAPGDQVLDAFGHSFTTARVCRRLGLDCVSVELSLHYCRLGAGELETEVIRPPETGPVLLPGYEPRAAEPT
jgi:hypothetical protein